MHPSDLNLTEYVDGSLDARERAAVAEHLERCPACRALVADLTELRRASAALGSMEPAARTWAQIGFQIEKSIVDDRRPSAASRRPAAGSRQSTVWLAAAAALVLATAGSGWGLRPPLRGGT